ncbi:MAG: hypothetical protein HS122_19480 [Opitutaceae bacterium]|nr:hypothetical protein [Opitutaceae bacterium]
MFFRRNKEATERDASAEITLAEIPNRKTLIVRGISVLVGIGALVFMGYQYQNRSIGGGNDPISKLINQQGAKKPDLPPLRVEAVPRQEQGPQATQPSTTVSPATEPTTAIQPVAATAGPAQSDSAPTLTPQAQKTTESEQAVIASPGPAESQASHSPPAKGKEQATQNVVIAATAIIEREEQQAPQQSKADAGKLKRSTASKTKTMTATKTAKGSSVEDDSDAGVRIF